MDESIIDRMLNLEEYINDLQQYSPVDSEEYSNNKLLSRFLERTLHLTIESFLDIGNHIISKERLGRVDYNTDVIRILAQNNIIKENEKSYIRMVQFRNVLVHDYADIDPEIIVDMINNHLNEVEDLFNWYKNYLNI